jgi:hypothetical protein
MGNACKGEMTKMYKFWLESIKERHHSGNQSVGGRTILQSML